MGNTNLKPTIYAQKQKERNILLKKMIKLQGKKQKEVTKKNHQFSSVQSLSRVRLFVTP